MLQTQKSGRNTPHVLNKEPESQESGGLPQLPAFWIHQIACHVADWGYGQLSTYRSLHTKHLHA